ncbi:MarR family transcriptional regulator [Dehalobacter sp. DCM]|uniref:MarR family winged helix-turn-helix transcriptional regulator n=1 Tax=Dehalobacter sp. DCM TaxID=2907827 RepID=UPI00308156F4|nr:MarR family transcriptional regulator [Dehalobacter sp. DCM]
MDKKYSEVDLVKLFFEIFKSFKRNMSKCFVDNGVTMPQGMVLTVLTHHGEMKISELSNAVNLSNSTISGIVDRLEKQELVIRTRSEDDRRIVYVKASPKAESFHKQHHDMIRQNMEKMLSKATPEEIEKIYDGLTVLKKVLNQDT